MIVNLIYKQKKVYYVMHMYQNINVLCSYNYVSGYWLDWNYVYMLYEVEEANRNMKMW